MANKRMFNMKIVDSDAFLDMPLSTQALYFHLNMRADDDGFVGNPKKIQRLVGASEDDLKLLIAKRFLLVFEDGVIVIKHWRMHNTIRKDRYTQTSYIEELNQLKLKGNNSYTLSDDESVDGLPYDNQKTPNWQPKNNQIATNGMTNQKKMVTNGMTKGKPNGNPDIGLDIGLDLDIEEDINIYAHSSPSLFESFESEFARPLSPIEVQLISDWEKEYEKDIIILALSESVKNNARNFRYIEVVLNSWKGAGVRTVDEAKHQIENRKLKVSNYHSQSNNKKLPDWFNNTDTVKVDTSDFDESELLKDLEDLRSSESVG